MKIKFPSLSVIGESAYLTFLRFPFVLLSSIIATVGVVWLINQDGASDEMEARIFALCFVGFLGISWLYAISVFLEQLKTGSVIKWGSLFAAALGLIGYYLYLDSILFEAKGEIWYQLVLFYLGTHLFAAFAPFVTSKNTDQFWEYNKGLFLRILISALYSLALFAGLSIALLALDVLLEINIEEEFYPSLFFVIGGIFNTWFFLSAVPKSDEIPEKEIDYPTGLKVFVQYVLIPLVTAYIVILYAYMLKIIVEWELPNGWVANLVLTFSIAGILSLLLLYPIQNQEGKKWIQLYSKWYYRALIPLIVLLMFSIWVRISEYGVTINRFFVATLGVWLTTIVIYFIFSKTKSIKVIPMSLIVFVIFSALGPFSAMNVSERSQLGRVLSMTDSEEFLNSKQQIEALDLDDEDLSQINSIVTYLVSIHGKESFEAILDQYRFAMLDTLSEDNVVTESSFIVEELMGLTWRSTANVTSADGLQYYNYSISNRGPIEISDYDYSLGTYTLNEYNDSVEVEIDDIIFNVNLDLESQLLSVVIDDETAQIKVAEIVQDLHRNNDLYWFKNDFDSEEMTVEIESGDYKLLLEIESISGTTGSEITLNSIKVGILVGEI